MTAFGPFHKEDTRNYYSSTYSYHQPIPLFWNFFPDRLKIAKVIPLFQKGDQHILDNYRPISLLPVISEVFQKIAFDNLYQYFTDNDIIFTSQYGFRKSHSTELASIELIDRIAHYIDSGKLSLSIFLDLSKAFDTLDHSILLGKLKFYGISNTPLKWFQSYLRSRQQFLEFDGICSGITFINTGVPQGSILGPLSFLIYMKDIHTASDKFDMILYADDTNLISPLCSFNSSFSGTKMMSNMRPSKSIYILEIFKNGWV